MQRKQQEGRQAPERKSDPGWPGGEATIETHPAYAMIGASRVSSNPGEYLFGSDFAHRHYMTVTIRRAEQRRDLSHDWHHGGEELISVAMSEAQWATFVSTTNVGFGVPCTMQRRGPFSAGEPIGMVPGIIQTHDRREQFRGEAKERLDLVAAALAKLAAAVADPEVTMPAKTRKALADNVNTARRNLEANLDYVVKCFDEHVERTVEGAKVEVSAYLTAAIQRAGLASLVEGSGHVIGMLDGKPEEGAK